MTQFKVTLTDQDGIVINTYEIDPNEMNWNTQPMRHLFSNELFNEMERHLKYNIIGNLISDD